MRQTTFINLKDELTEDDNLVFRLKEYKKYTRVTFYAKKGYEIGSNKFATYYEIGSNNKRFDNLVTYYKEQGYTEVKI